MLPTNVYSFMKKMVSNTESTLATGQTYVAPSNSPPGAMGRLRQTLQQAQESVSNRLSTTKTSTGSTSLVTQAQQPLEPPTFTTTDMDLVPTPTEEVEQPRPGSVGRCRVCVKAMKPDEYFRDCTECGLRVCDDCASYSTHADGNEINWRCSVCRRKGVAIIARRVQVGIESSEALEGVGFETKVRRSPDTRRLTAGDRADSETEVLLLAPRASDVRRHSDVPLRDIAKFQQQTNNMSSATSQHDLGLGLSVQGAGDKVRARSTQEITITTERPPEDKGGGQGAVDHRQGQGPKDRDKEHRPKDKEVEKAKGKAIPAMKRQRSYERGASEGNLNLPGGVNNRARRASCDLRAIDPNALANLNTLNSQATSPAAAPPEKTQTQSHSDKSHSDKSHSDKSHSDKSHSDKSHQDKSHSDKSHSDKSHQDKSHSDKSHSDKSHSQPSEKPKDKPKESHPRRESKVERPKEDSLIINKGDNRRRSVQIYGSKPTSSSPRSCASLDHAGADEAKMKRQGSSTDGEVIKIVIDDVDSDSTINAKKDNNKSNNLTELNEQRTRFVRLRRDPQDRGYQTRGFGLRIVGGCSCTRGTSPGNLRARVARVTTGSSADFAGIRRGDVVLSWNGIKLTNLTFEDTCKVIDASTDSVELHMACFESSSAEQALPPPLISTSVPEDEDGGGGGGLADWEESSAATANANEESLGFNPNAASSSDLSPTRRKLPRLPAEGRIQLRLYHDEIHNTLEIAVVNIAFGPDDSTSIDLNDIIITLRIADKVANTRWNQCTLFTKVSPEDLFDSWLVMELVRGTDFIGEAHVDMGRVSLDDRPVWFPFSSKGSSAHRGSIATIMTNPAASTPSARELARRLRMRGLAAGSQSQSEEQDDSSGQSSPCASSLLRPEVAWEVLGTLGPPGVVLTCRSAPTSRRGSAQSDRALEFVGGLTVDDGRGSLPSTPQMPRSLPPSRRGSFAVAVEEVIRSRRGSVVSTSQPQHSRVPDYLGRLLPEIPDGGGGPDPSMLRNRRTSAWNPREVGFDSRRQQFERTDSLRQINPQGGNRRVSADFRDFGNEARNRQQRKSVCGGGGGEGDESWRHNMQQQQQQPPQQQWAPRD